MQLADPGTSPVGGAALDQVIGLTAGAGVITLVLLFIAWQHRTHRIEWFQKLGDVTGRTFGTTSWGALPVIFIAGSLLTAYLGFMWDVSLHAGRGRDDERLGLVVPTVVLPDRVARDGVVGVRRPADGAAEGVPGQLYLFKNNVDSRGNSYGSHENYLIARRTEFARLVRPLTAPQHIERAMAAGSSLEIWRRMWPVIAISLALSVGTFLHLDRGSGACAGAYFGAGHVRCHGDQ